MAQVRINWKLIIVLLIAVSVLAGTACYLRYKNRSQRSQRALTAGLKAYEAGQWDAAADNLGRYLGRVQDDAEILSKYADAQLKRRPLKQPNIVQATNAYRRILRLDESYEIDDLRRKTVLQLVGLYLQMNIPSEAELIAARRLEAGNDNEIRRMLAVAYISQRKFAAAAAELDKIIKDDPSQVPAYDAMGQLAEQRPDDFSVGAEHWYDEAIRNNPRSAQAYIIRGDYFLRKKQDSKALDDLEQAEKLDLSDISIRLALANSLIRAGHSDKAQDHLASVEEDAPANINLWKAWAMLAMKDGSRDKMREVADRGLAELASEVAAFLPLATELYIRAGDFEKAGGCVEQLRQEDAESAMIAFMEGYICERKGRWADALKKYRQAVDLGMQTENVQIRIASALVRLGDKVAATAQLRTLLNKNEDSYTGRLALARLLVEEHKYTEAVEHAQILARRQPRRAEGHLLYMQARIGLLVEKKTDSSDPLWDAVEADLRKLSENLEDAVSVKTMRIHVAMQRGRLDQAQQMVEELKEQHPDEIQPKLAEVDVLVGRNEIDPAIERLEDIVGKFPESTLSVSYLVNLLARREEYSRCRTVLTDAIARIRQPESLRILNLTLAEIYARNNKPNEACRLLESVSKQLPNDIPVLRKLLGYRQAIGRNEGLQDMVDRIKSLEGDDGWQWRVEQARLWFGLPLKEFNMRWPQAASLLKENLNANPDDQLSRRLLAACYERSGRLQLAISLYTQAFERSPNDINIIIPMVAMLYKAQRYEQADEILDRATRNNVGGLTDTRLSRLVLQRHGRRGDLEPAGEILENLLSANPENRDDRFTLALIRMLQNNHAEARKLLRQLRIKDPDYLPAVAGLVELNIREGKRDDALKICEEIVQRLKNPAAYILRSRAYVRLGEIQHARDDMEKAISLEPDNVRNLQLKAAFYQAIGEPDVAVAAIDKALSVSPDDFLVLKQAAFLLLASQEKQDFERGKALLDKAIKARADDVELLVQRVGILVGQGTAPALKEAEQMLKDLVGKRPGNERLWTMLATMYLNEGDSAKAMNAALNGLSHLPRSRALMLIKATAEARRSPELAIGTLRQLLDERPDDINVAVDLARTYSAAGKHDKAIRLLEEKLASAKDSDKRKIDIVLATILYDSGKTTQAVEKFKSLRASQPDDTEVVVAHAGVLIKSKVWTELIDLTVDWCDRYPDKTGILAGIVKGVMSQGGDDAAKTAETILRRVMTSHPDCVVAISSLAMLMHTQERMDEAVELYEKILVLEPGNLVAMNNLAWILCEEHGEYQRAMELVEKGLAMNPGYIDLIDTSGMIHYRTKQFDKAAGDFKKCVALYPEKAPALAGSYFHLAKTFDQMGDKQQAVDNLRKSIVLKGLSQKDLNEAEKLLTKLMQ
ncbi:MAG: hypothetical protein DRP66_03560 [Planctomycetota bacterium]|nr:MAG: hypothetical protein DRP66_03560 [Planctomycetota bacterium]